MRRPPSTRSRRRQAPRVTALRELSGGRVEVHLDGAPWRTVPAEAVVRSGLATGLEFERPLARALAREPRRSAALREAARALRHRDLSAGELDERLARRGVAGSGRTGALAALEAAGLVDDTRFAAARAQALAARGWGNAAVQADLERRHVGPEPLAAALGALEPEAERARRLLERRGVSAASARWLAGRGFGEEAVEAALDGLVAADA